MVGRQSAILGGKRGAMLVGQLFGVKPYSQAVRRGRLEQAFDLVRGERNGVAISIDDSDLPRLGGGGDQLVDDVAQIMRSAVALGSGDGVKREQGRDDPHCRSIAERVGELEEAQFALYLEAVASFHLDRRATAAHQCVKASARAGQQVFVACSRGFGDGRGDSAAGLGDFLIGRSSAAHRMFVGAIAAEDQMGVTIDQTGRDPGAAKRGNVLGSIAGELGAFADSNHLAVGDSDRSIVDDAQRIARRGFERRDAAIDEQAVPHGGGFEGQAC